MQQISPKDRPKLIGLIVGVVLVLGFGIKSTMDTLATVNGTAPAPTAAATPAAGTDATAVTGTSAPVPAPTASPAATGAFVLNNTYSAERDRDPFTPVTDKVFADYSIKIPGFAPPPPPREIVTGNTGPLGRGTFKAFRAGLKPLQERVGNVAQLSGEMEKVGRSVVIPEPKVQVLPPPPPPYTVIGVLIGEPGGRDVAILSRTPGNDKKFVVAGDMLEGGYTVTAIDSGGVRVSHPGRRPTTATIPGAAPVLVGGGLEYYLPKQTTVVPATSVTLPLEGTADPNAPAKTPGVK